MIKKSVSLTPEGKKDLERELAELKKQRPEITERIAIARDFGDLKENEENSSARNEQKVAEDRILEIEEILKNAKVIRGGKRTKVGLGTVVKLDMGGKKVEYSLVGTIEADPLAGKISDESPIGKELVGRKEGESFDFNGKKVKILELK